MGAFSSPLVAACHAIFPISGLTTSVKSRIIAFRKEPPPAKMGWRVAPHEKVAESDRAYRFTSATSLAGPTSCSPTHRKLLQSKEAVVVDGLPGLLG